jgi:diguanylate cyclase (GGDEF)-like protein
MGKMKLNLRARILFIATAVMLCAVGAVIATSTLLSSREYEAALQSRSLAIGKSLTVQFERLLQLGLDVGDIIGFEEQCQEVVRIYPGIDVAMAVDPDGLILFHSDNLAGSLQDGLIDSLRAGAEVIVSQTADGMIRHNVVIPARNPQGVHVASIIVGFPAALITEKLERMLWSDLGVALLVVLTGVAMLYAALARFVTRPLGSLTATVSRMREAPLDLTRRTSVASDDELGELGSAFNGLMDELQNTTVSKTELEGALQELQRVSAALFEQKQHLEVTLGSIGDAVIGVDAALTVRYLNPVAERILDWPLEAARGKPLQEVLQLENVSTKNIIFNPFDPVFREGKTVSNKADVELRRRNSAIAVNYTAAAMRGRTGELTGGVLTLRDVSAERSMAQRLSWEASHDPLTGLINRREFTARVETALVASRTVGQQHAVCFMDLDRFKAVNDTGGHAAGDEFLKALAAVLRSRIRHSDSLARLGGDEFALLLEGCSMDRAQLIAADLLSTVRDFRFDFKGKAYTVGISIGLAPVTGDANCGEVLSMADTACYLAKEQGRNRVCVYRVDNSDIVTRRREASWVTRINSALTEDRFVLYYQNYLSLNPREQDRDHLEVLLRMIDEEGNLVPPGSFLPAAERYNLMPAIDRMVIKKVFTAYRRLVTERGGRALTCAINLSGTSLNTNDLFEFIRQQAAEHSLPPGSICFEITETAAINNLRNASEFVRNCKSIGMLFALDDFGTGASSFGYLKNLQVDYLKIDGSFVRNMEGDGIDRAMTETINRIGKIMGIRTVAEYAENETIIRELRKIGVDYAQGFGVSVPAPLFGRKAADSPELKKAL